MRTKRTRVRFFFCMRPFVRVVLCFGCRRVITETAFVFLLPRMRCFVVLQLLFCAEGSFAMRTVVSMVSGMSA
jgi:hypothetical protein